MAMIKKLCQLWLLLISLVTSCSNKERAHQNKECDKMENEKFYYEISCSAPRLSPGEYISVEYIGESGTLRCFGSGNINNGMGNGHDGVSRNEENRYGLPKAIEAIWVSYTDRKVYAFSSLIPYDTILSLFRNEGEPSVSTQSEEKKHVMNCFDLCFLPGGKVMLYVKAPAKSVLLDWSANGVEVTDDKILHRIYNRYNGVNDMKSYFDKMSSYPEDEFWLSYLRKHGSPAQLIERYIQRFNYSLNFEFEDSATSICKVKSQYTNGEYYWATPKYNEEFEFPSRIKEFRAEWDTQKYHYTCFMYFNEEEMLRVFDEAYGDDRMQKGELKINVCKYNNFFDIFLNVGEKSIRLEKTQIRVFQDPVEDPDGDGTLIYKNYEDDHTNHFADNDKYLVE